MSQSDSHRCRASRSSWRSFESCSVVGEPPWTYPLEWGGSNFLGESQSRIYPHMRVKFGRGPTVVSKKGVYDYETFTSLSGTILPTMCQLFVCREQYCQQCVKFWW